MQLAPQKLEIKCQYYDDTPSMRELIHATHNTFQLMEKCLNTVDKLCKERGFKIVLHNSRQTDDFIRFYVFCHMYKNTRCPFTLNYRKVIGTKYFALDKYRSEHNHALLCRNDLFKV